MAAVIRYLVSRSERLRRDHVAKAREALAELVDFATLDGSQRQAAVKLLAAVDAATCSEGKWRFLMMSPSEFGAVHEYLFQHARRRSLALRLWTLCLSHIRMDTGELTLSRSEFAECLGVSPKHVTEVMADLVKVGAISVERHGREVRYFMNPTVGTHLSGAARDEAQRKAGPLKLVGGFDASDQR